MAFNINEIRANMALDGARPTQFMVQINNPFDGIAATKSPFIVKAASMPASVIGQIEVPYFGRTIKLAGDRAYDNWTCQVMNDEDFLLRNSMEAWHALINSTQGNLRAQPGLGYKSTAIVTQFGKTGTIIRQYQIEGIFPIQVGDVALAWDRMNQIEEFGIVFAVDRWYTLGGATGAGEPDV